MPTNVGGVTQVTHHATTVDGVNLDEIREFAKAFKLRRLALGLTQTQVGQALSATKGPAYSQSAICRFEKLDITPKSAAKIKPVLEKWMQEAELKYADR
jgi:class 6 POU domain transcription factor